MSDLWNQGWFALEMFWFKIRDVIGDHIVLSVMIVAIFVLIWHLLSPQVKNKGS